MDFLRYRLGILHKREGFVPAKPSFFYLLFKTKKTYLPFLSKEGKACLKVHTLTNEPEKLTASYLVDC